MIPPHLLQQLRNTSVRNLIRALERDGFTYRRLRLITYLHPMSNTPTHLIYHGKGPKGGKKIWTKIGAVWPAKSGNSFTITWDHIPRVDGITVMLPYDKRPDDDIQVVPDKYPA